MPARSQFTDALDNDGGVSSVLLVTGSLVKVATSLPEASWSGLLEVPAA